MKNCATNFKRIQASSDKISFGNWALSLLAKLILLAIIISSGFFGRLYYEQNTEVLCRKIARLKKSIHKTEREIAQQRIRKAKLSETKYINARIQRYGLKLRQADPNQIYKKTLVNYGTPSKYSEQTALLK